MKKILFFLLFPATIYSQTNSGLIDEYMQAQAKLYGFSGNVLVAKNGKPLYQRSFGYADDNNKRKLDSNSVFDIGSIAKEFTAVGILLLKDKGKISYTDTLRKFFPELPYANITIQQLLTHTSGIPDGFALVTAFFDHNKIATNDDLVRLLAREKPPLFFKPGKNLQYSGTGFNLLACIIEKVTGQPYTTYMNEQVFKPLGMTHTSVVNGPRSLHTIPGYAYGYTYSDSLKKYVWADELMTGWTTYLAGITGEGMIITTTGDLLKWDRSLKDHRLLNEITQQQMLSPQAERKVVPLVRYFGYGMRVGKNEFGDYIFHNGLYPGYATMHIRYIKEDITVIVLSNNESHSDFIADGLASIILQNKIVLPYRHKKNDTNVIPAEYTGRYMMQLSRPPYMALFPIEFIHQNNRLYIHSLFSADKELLQESATKFFFADGTDQQIEFETGAGGQPVKVWHIAWGVKRLLTKMD